MPADMEKIFKTKDTIISTIRLKGPTLPIHIARTINLNTIFTSAFLSELYAEKRLLMSCMKVGSSSLYFLPGQEAQLENFIEFLNQKEQEAFLLLKKEKVLDDESLLPAIRVAIREIKDFAVPLKVRMDEQVKMFWKYYLLSDTEASSLIESLISPKKDKKESSFPTEKKEAEILAHQLPDKPQELTKEKIEEKPKKIKTKKSTEEFKFPKKIKEYLASKDIEILSIIEEKAKDFIAKVRLDTLLGKQELYLVARDKKKITDDDLTIALHKAQLEKMPAIFLATGDIDKKSLDHAKTWRNLIKFEKTKI